MAETEIGFYHLTALTLEKALPRLLEKIYQAKLPTIVMTLSEGRVEDLASLLWTYHPMSFLPHGTAKDGQAARQPIWITSQDENPNEATVLVLVDGTQAENWQGFQRILYLFNGHDEEAIKAARLLWSTLKREGHNLTYWQQDEKGSWSKKEV